MSRLAESLNEAMARKRQEGLSEGRREGSIQTLSEIAGHRFGPDVAGALRAHLALIGDPGAVRRSGVALLDCASGAEVLARLRKDGHDPGADGP